MPNPLLFFGFGALVMAVPATLVVPVTYAAAPALGMPELREWLTLPRALAAVPVVTLGFALWMLVTIVVALVASPLTVPVYALCVYGFAAVLLVACDRVGAVDGLEVDEGGQFVGVVGTLLVVLPGAVWAMLV